MHWVRGELFLATLRAEVVRHASIFTLRTGLGDLELHSADGILGGGLVDGIGGLLHTGLRIEQEAGCQYDPLALIQAFDDLDAAGEALAGFDLAGLEIAVAQIDEDGFLQARIEYGIERHCHYLRDRYL